MMGEACGELRGGGDCDVLVLVRGVEGARGKGRKGGGVEKVVVLDRMLWRCVIHLPSYQMHTTQLTKTYLR